MAGDRSPIPRVATQLSPEELRRLPLTPVDGFVLSRVDGRSSTDDIATSTGLALDQVAATLERLAKLSLVVLDGRDGAPGRSTSQTFATQGAAKPPAAPIMTPAPSSGERPASEAASAERELDLTVEEQQRIGAAYAMLDATTHYELLGVGHAADRKEIKRAYYERAALYHPDRYFRKRVGDFKPKLEAIFNRVTVAHDVLTDRTQRADYDAYLGLVAQSHELESRVASAEAKVRAAEEAARVDPIFTPAPESSQPVVVVTSGTGSPAPAAPRATAPAPDAAPAKPLAPIDAQARRDLLAKHLRGGRRPSSSGFAAPVVSAAPPATTTPPPAPDRDALRRHYEQRKGDARRIQAREHRRVGDEARATGDFIAAASSYKAALSFTPDDLELSRLYEETKTAAERSLVETYRTQADYESKSHRWADAARSWAKVAQLLPNDADALEKAAEAILKHGGNLHEGAGYAQRAIALGPNVARRRALLANIYLEVGLFKNAKREIDAAAALAPDDASIAELARRIGAAIVK